MDAYMADLEGLVACSRIAAGKLAPPEELTAPPGETTGWVDLDSAERGTAPVVKPRQDDPGDFFPCLVTASTLDLTRFLISDYVPVLGPQALEPWNPSIERLRTEFEVVVDSMPEGSARMWMGMLRSEFLPLEHYFRSE